jgi:hypothetical protein
MISGSNGPVVHKVHIESCGLGVLVKCTCSKELGTPVRSLEVTELFQWYAEHIKENLSGGLNP